MIYLSSDGGLDPIGRYPIERTYHLLLQLITVRLLLLVNNLFLNPLKCLLQIRFEIIYMFNADRKTHVILAYACSIAVFIGQLLMSRAPGVDNQRFGISEAVCRQQDLFSERSVGDSLSSTGNNLQSVA
jgi:hypothetical protein